MVQLQTVLEIVILQGGPIKTGLF